MITLYNIVQQLHLKYIAEFMYILSLKRTTQFQKAKLITKTSILKVLLKQYKSPIDPNKFYRGITPEKLDERKQSGNNSVMLKINPQNLKLLS